MASMGDLVVNLIANNSQFKRGMTDAAKAVQQFSTAALAIGAAATGGMIKFAADAEALQVKLEVLLKSGTAAAAMFRDIGEFAASTPFQKMEIADAAQKLLAFNTPAADVMSTLRQLGDVSALTGNSIGEMAELFGKAQVQGRLFMEDINQLTGRGIPIMQQLAKQFGVTEGEVRSLVSAGRVTADNLQRAFRDMTNAGGQFAGGMGKLSKTTAGQLSTLKDNVVAIGERMGAVLLPVANSIVGSFTKLLQTTRNLPRGLMRIVAAMVAVGAAFKAVALAQMAFAKASAVAQALSGPKGWATLAAGIAVAAGAMAAVDNVMGDVTESLAETTVAIDDLTGKANGLGKVMPPPVSPGRDLDKLKESLETFDDLQASSGDAFVKQMAEAAVHVKAISGSFDEFDSRMQRVVNQQSGFNDALQSARDDLFIAKGGTRGQLQVNRFRDMGVDESSLSTLQDIIAAKEKLIELEKQELDRKRAQKQLDDIRTRDKIAAARAVVAEAKKNVQSGIKLAGANTRGSGAINRAIAARTSLDPQKEALKEQKRATQVLEELLAEERNKQVVELVAQGAI